MRKFVCLLTLICCFSCKKNESEISSDDFLVTFDGASYTCTGFKSLIDSNDINRLNQVLGNESNYNGTVIGLIDLKGSYNKNDKIKVRLTRYERPEHMVCPTFSLFPSVLIVNEQLVN